MSVEITTTVGVLVEADEALARICALKLPVRAAYAAAKLARQVKQELGTFYELRRGYILSLGKDDGKGGVTVSAENMAEYQRLVHELVGQSVTLTCWPIVLDAWGDVSIVPSDLAALGPLLADSFEPHA